jgi:hypothetical protein
VTVSFSRRTLVHELAGYINPGYSVIWVFKTEGGGGGSSSQTTALVMGHALTFTCGQQMLAFRNSFTIVIHNKAFIE